MFEHNLINIHEVFVMLWYEDSMFLSQSDGWFLHSRTSLSTQWHYGYSCQSVIVTQTQEVWGSTRGVWVTVTRFEPCGSARCAVTVVDYHTRCSSLSPVFSACDWGAFQADCCLSALVLRGRDSAEPHTHVHWVGNHTGCQLEGILGS